MTVNVEEWEFAEGVGRPAGPRSAFDPALDTQTCLKESEWLPAQL
jgi:hypothetical protein